MNLKSLPFCSYTHKSLCMYALAPSSWGGLVRHQLFYSFAAPQVIETWPFSPVLFDSHFSLPSWLTLQLLKLLLVLLGVNVYVLKALFQLESPFEACQAGREEWMFCHPVFTALSTTGLTFCDCGFFNYESLPHVGIFCLRFRSFCLTSPLSEHCFLKL